MSKLCSVVCSTYNHSAFSRAALQSLYNQTYRNIEIIVIDDGSNDGNVDVIREKLKNCPFHSIFITQKNSGNVPKNLNTAIEKASGEYITFLSLDDLLLPECIRTKIEIMEKDSCIAFVASTRNQEIEASGAILNRSVPMPIDSETNNSIEDILEIEFKNIGAFYIQGQVFRHDLIKAVGGFERNLTGDDIILRTKIFQYMIEKREMSFQLIHTPGFAYRLHGSNLHKSIFRQIKTVVEWREAFFPERRYPDLFYDWLEYFFYDCRQRNTRDQLKFALKYRPEIARHYRRVTLYNWKHHARELKRCAKKFLGKL